MGFAKLEVIHVFTGRTATTPGKLVDCFNADDLSLTAGTLRPSKRLSLRRPN